MVRFVKRPRNLKTLSGADSCTAAVNVKSDGKSRKITGHTLHTRGVIGSIPIPPTMPLGANTAGTQLVAQGDYSIDGKRGSFACSYKGCIVPPANVIDENCDWVLL